MTDGDKLVAATLAASFVSKTVEKPTIDNYVDVYIDFVAAMEIRDSLARGDHATKLEAEMWRKSRQRT
jgi:hypothetical protein